MNASRPSAPNANGRQSSPTAAARAARSLAPGGSLAPHALAGVDAAGILGESWLVHDGTADDVGRDTVLCEFRVAVLGDAAVGKSTLVGTAIGAPYADQFPSGEADMILFKTRTSWMGNYAVRVELWDAPGAARCRTATAKLADARSMTACMLVFDLTDRASFESLADWATSTHLLHPATSQFTRPTIVVGTKADLVAVPAAAAAAAAAGTAFLPDSLTTGLGMRGSTSMARSASMVRSASFAASAAAAAAAAAALLPPPPPENPLHAVPQDEARAWAAARGGEYVEINAANGKAVGDAVDQVVRMVARAMPGNVLVNPAALVDLNVRPTRPLRQGKNVEYMNLARLHRAMPDTTDKVDWLE
ncbi:Ras- protein Rab-42 [Allomyces javanicus]|nr:Ras- protein Rab-42 [Allomyces javanicus]